MLTHTHLYSSHYMYNFTFIFQIKYLLYFRSLIWAFAFNPCSYIVQVHILVIDCNHLISALRI